MPWPQNGDRDLRSHSVLVTAVAAQRDPCIDLPPNDLRSSRRSHVSSGLGASNPQKVVPNYYQIAPHAPLDQILALYCETNSPRSFADDLAAHLRHGVVVSTADVLVLARPVISTASIAQINDPAHAFPPAACDTWYVYAFAGDLRTAIGFFPYPLPYIAFERACKNGLRFLSLDRFLRKCQGLLPAK